MWWVGRSKWGEGGGVKCQCECVWGVDVTQFPKTFRMTVASLLMLLWNFSIYKDVCELTGHVCNKLTNDYPITDRLKQPTVQPGQLSTHLQSTHPWSTHTHSILPQSTHQDNAPAVNAPKVSLPTVNAPTVNPLNGSQQIHLSNHLPTQKPSNQTTDKPTHNEQHTHPSSLTPTDRQLNNRSTD